MPGRSVWIALLAAAALVAGCGGSDDDGGGGNTDTGGSAKQSEAKQGGTLTYLWAGDTDYLDPGQTYYQAGYEVEFAVNRRLYAQQPDGKTVPDLAEGEPEVSDDGRTITIKIKPGVKYAPPVNRAVKADDLEYAFERAFTINVPNGYATAYFAELEGVPDAPGKYQDLPGVEATDDTTLVLKTTKDVSARIQAALVLPITIPVPREYAEKYDAKSPSTYDSYVAFSGAYMVKNDAKGKVVGRQPGKRIEIVRNPNWDKATDFRPAYLDSIIINEGNDDGTVAARRTLAGESLVCCDSGAPPPAVLREVLRNKKDQLSGVPAGSVRYVALNTTMKPFDNLNVRKAIVAGVDREALRQTAGGAVRGPVAEGYLPPGMAGFEQSGGEKGFTDFDWMQNPKGDLELAKKYMLAAKDEGVPVSDDGLYTGDKLLMISGNTDAVKVTTETLVNEMAKLGFKFNNRAVPQDTLYTKFCGVPKAKVAICPGVAWGKDFNDAESMLVPTFRGDQIRAAGNTNWPQLKDAAVDAAMKKAGDLPAGEERAAAWAEANKAIVAQAPAIPWLWDQQLTVHSKNVNLVQNEAQATVDFPFTSLK
jgi:peptide/nickel transport system substrate-binding protein